MRAAGTLREIARFIGSWRSLPPYELASYPLMFASVPLLAAEAGRPYNLRLVKTVVLVVVSLYAGFFAALIANDLSDADIDAVVHPDRPLPGGHISQEKFLFTGLLLGAVAVGVASLISPYCLLVNAATGAFVFCHDRYLKRWVPIPAYSEICTPLQWVMVGIFGYVAVWSTMPAGGDLAISLGPLGRIATSAHDLGNMVLLALFIYFTDAAHDIPEGIADADGDRWAGVRTYATSFGERAATRVALTWYLLSGVLGVALFARTALSPLFLAAFVVLFCYSGASYLRLALQPDGVRMRALAPLVGRRGFNHFLFTFNLIFIDLLAQRAYAWLRGAA